MNLFLYIPPYSAHPKNTTKSLIFGLLQTYKCQNPNHQDFINIGKLLFQRLRDRGHTHSDLRTLFKDALYKLDKKLHLQTIKNNNLRTSNQRKISTLEEINKNLFLHLEFHPKGLSRQKIQQIYHAECTKQHNDDVGFDNIRNDNTNCYMRIEKLTVAYSRPKNLRDTLCPSTLRAFDDDTVSTISSKLKNNT